MFAGDIPWAHVTRLRFRRRAHRYGGGRRAATEGQSSIRLACALACGRRRLGSRSGGCDWWAGADRWSLGGLDGPFPASSDAFPVDYAPLTTTCLAKVRRRECTRMADGTAVTASTGATIDGGSLASTLGSQGSTRQQHGEV
jgi:hypothetical protein